MALIVEPHRYISPLVNNELKKGTSIVNLLTNYKTPCYVYQDNVNLLDIGMIATNVGVTLSEENLTSFIFRRINSDEIYTVKYISKIEKILRTPAIPIPINSLKQLPKSYFSEIKVNGDYEDILLEFEDNGWEIIRTKANPKGWRENAQVVKELWGDHKKNFDEIKKKALFFYKKAN